MERKESNLDAKLSGLVDVSGKVQTFCTRTEDVFIKTPIISARTIVASDTLWLSAVVKTFQDRVCHNLAQVTIKSVVCCC